MKSCHEVGHEQRTGALTQKDPLQERALGVATKKDEKEEETKKMKTVNKQQEEQEEQEKKDMKDANKTVEEREKTKMNKMKCEAHHYWRLCLVQQLHHRIRWPLCTRHILQINCQD